MSVPERDIRFTTAARRDLRHMALYTRRAWGSQRQASYRAAIVTAFETLREFPDLGRLRDDIFSGCRSFPVEHHVIYYDQPDDATIVVRRIQRQRQEASAAVRDPRM